jgi:hypothetical protein
VTDPRLQRLAREWQQNRRLRLGALVILVILGVHASLVLADRRHARAEEYDRDAALLARLDEASRESAWPQRATAAETALTEVRNSIPAARSDGLAQAEMQAWLTDLAAFAGLASPTVRVETSLAVPGQDGLWQVLARLDAVVPEGRMRVLVRPRAGALPGVPTERLDLQAGRDTRVSLVVRGYFRSADGSEKAAARPADLPAAGNTPAPVVPYRSPLAPLAKPAPSSDGDDTAPTRGARASRASQGIPAPSGSRSGVPGRSRSSRPPPPAPTGRRP